MIHKSTTVLIKNTNLEMCYAFFNILIMNNGFWNLSVFNEENKTLSAALHWSSAPLQGWVNKKLY